MGNRGNRGGVLGPALGLLALLIAAAIVMYLYACATEVAVQPGQTATGAIDRVKAVVDANAERNRQLEKQLGLDQPAPTTKPN